MRFIPVVRGHDRPTRNLPFAPAYSENGEQSPAAAHQVSEYDAKRKCGRTPACRLASGGLLRIRKPVSNAGTSGFGNDGQGANTWRAVTS